MNIAQRWLVVAAAVLAATCTSEEVSAPAPEPPTADAGPDQVVRDRDGSGSELVVLQASASQPGSHDITTYRWLEDKQEIVGVSDDGSRTLGVELNLGRHLILLEVTNGAGLSDKDLVTVDVLPPDPSVTIGSPRSGVAFATGSEIQFTGSGVDQYEEPIAEQHLSWTSDLDGLLGTGELLVLDGLSRGTHAITLTGTDRDGFVGHASVEIRVEHPPTVAILSPSDGEEFVWSEEVPLLGSCASRDGTDVDPEALIWYTGSSPYSLGRGYEASVKFVHPGAYVISSSCTDVFDGFRLSADASVTVEVLVSYQSNVAPALDDFGCTKCHSGEAPPGGVSLDSYQAIIDGSTAHGPLIAPGHPAQGVLTTQMTTFHHDPDPWSLPETWWWLYPQIWHSPYDIPLGPWWAQNILAAWIEAGAPGN